MAGNPESSDRILTPEKARELSLQNRFPLDGGVTSSNEGPKELFYIPPEGVDVDSQAIIYPDGYCRFWGAQGKSLGYADLAYVLRESRSMDPEVFDLQVDQVRRAILGVLTEKGLGNKIPYTRYKGKED